MCRKLLTVFTQLLVNIYIATGTPVKIAEGFLAIFTTGVTFPPPFARNSMMMLRRQVFGKLWRSI
jgi:hypothetical protein